MRRLLNPRGESIAITGPVTLMTAISYARIASCSTATVKRDLADGVIEGCKLGGTWLVALPKGSTWKADA